MQSFIFELLNCALLHVLVNNARSPRSTLMQFYHISFLFDLTCCSPGTQRGGKKPKCQSALIKILVSEDVTVCDFIRYIMKVFNHTSYLSGPFYLVVRSLSFKTTLLRCGKVTEGWVCIFK